MKSIITFILCLTAALGWSLPIQIHHAAVARLRVAGGGGGGIPSPDLVHWPLNDASGSTIAAAVGSGSTTSTGTLNSDYLSMASGNAAFTSTSSTAWASNTVSASFWFRKDGWSTSGTVFWSSYLGTGTRFQVAQEGGWTALFIQDATGTLKQWVYQPFALNTWVHVVAIWDNSTSAGSTALYINGSAVSLTTDATTKTGTGNFTTDQLSIKSIYGDSNVFDLDDLRIYGRALTGGEITAIHAAGRP